MLVDLCPAISVYVICDFMNNCFLSLLCTRPQIVVTSKCNDGGFHDRSCRKFVGDESRHSRKCRIGGDGRPAWTHIHPIACIARRKCRIGGDGCPFRTDIHPISCITRDRDRYDAVAIAINVTDLTTRPTNN